MRLITIRVTQGSSHDSSTIAQASFTDQTHPNRRTPPDQHAFWIHCFVWLILLFYVCPPPHLVSGWVLSLLLNVARLLATMSSDQACQTPNCVRWLAIRALCTCAVWRLHLSCWWSMLFTFHLKFGAPILGPDPSQTLNYGLQLRSVKFSASGVRQVSRSKISNTQDWVYYVYTKSIWPPAFNCGSIPSPKAQ